ncbi:aldehyde dehydrogenase domain-containing protein [Neurospora tetraspora]|uniref:aldehyde dehydrogenase (NAD(+)) n=1 Tax=Neurospora tetraspora TaxID=94610 RepID=A0AAE0J822_9PEZI|nr:aldehyde dehydrogenase domain-containing protein [Neurospora tetraspora]
MASTTDYKIDFTTFYNVINNELKSTPTTRTAINPSTLAPLPPVPVSTKSDVDAAVSAAKAAFPSWRDTPVDERSALIDTFADAIRANFMEFASLLALEGKPPMAAQFEVDFAIKHLKGTAQLRLEEEVVEDTEEKLVKVRYTPLGVGVGIVPFNYPVFLGLGKLGPAVLAGNAFIWKPSPYTPNTALKLVELAAKIFPPGVVQALSGEEDLGPWLTAHPDIRKISFTGSTPTGKKVMAACASTLKRVTLELGGNDAAIVCEDVDLAQVVPKVALGAFNNAGQLCVDIKRIFVHEKIYDQFLAGMVEAVKTFKFGGSDDTEGAFFPPVQNAMQFEKVKEMFAQIKKEGWKPAIGGEVEAEAGEKKGYYFKPTIIDNPPEESRIVQEEPFGPILPVLKWNGDEDEVVRMANNTDMGLGASVWSSDLERAERIAKRLEAGSLWINTHQDLHANVPFGGFKQSGMGHDWGIIGLKGWCNTQSLLLRRSGGII